MRGIHRSPVNFAQRPVTRSSDVFFDLRLNKQVSKQSWGWWFETPSDPLWHHCNVCERFYVSYLVGSGSCCIEDVWLYMKIRCWVLQYVSIGAIFECLLMRNLNQNIIHKFVWTVSRITSYQVTDNPFRPMCEITNIGIGIHASKFVNAMISFIYCEFLHHETIAFEGKSKLSG